MFKIDSLISSHGNLPDELINEAYVLYYMGMDSPEIGQEINEIVRRKKRRRIAI